MDKETRISYDNYYNVVVLLEPRWRVVQVGDLYSLQYKNRKANGWGKEPRGNEAKSLEKIMEVYQTRVKQRSGTERNKIQKEMHILWLEGHYKHNYNHIQLSKGLYGEPYIGMY